MFTLTNEAAARLAYRLAKQNATGSTFRFVREDHGWRLRLGNVMDGDKIFQHRDRAVLVLDSLVADGLSDRTLGLRQTHAGPRLHLQRNDG